MIGGKRHEFTSIDGDLARSYDSPAAGLKERTSVEAIWALRSSPVRPSAGRKSAAFLASSNHDKVASKKEKNIMQGYKVIHNKR
jgi:hypothetical protein